MLQGFPTIEYMFDIEAYANTLGITVAYRPLPDHLPPAWWNPRSKTITAREGLPRRKVRSLIAHELGHAHYGHTISTPKAERQADQYAAQLLINADDYRRAEAAYGTSIEKLAYELDVTPSLIVAWRREHETSKGTEP